VQRLPAKRPYRRSGLYRSTLTPEEQRAMEVIRDELLADCGGEEHVSTARKLLIDLAAAAAVRCQRVNAYLATLDHLVDRRRRREWTVVNDARRAEAHLQGLLRDIGLERGAAPVPSLDDYLSSRVNPPAPGTTP
jgi:hypothetical protein